MSEKEERVDLGRRAIALIPMAAQFATDYEFQVIHEVLGEYRQGTLTTERLWAMIGSIAAVRGFGDYLDRIHQAGLQEELGDIREDG